MTARMVKAFLRAGIALWLLGASVCALAGEGLLPLWEARGPSGTIYLFGSIHVCKAECFPLPDAALKRLTRSQALVVELDSRSPEIQARALRAGQLPPAQILAQRLTPEDWQLTKTLADELGLPIDALCGLQPWLASTTLTLLAARRAGFEIDQGIDLAFMAQAASQQLPIEALETVAEQIAALGAGSGPEQRAAYHLALEQIRDGTLDSALDDLLVAWRGGDLVTLQRLIAESVPTGSPAARELIDRRNVRMTNRLVQRMRDHRDRFVVVGFAHLAGRTGLPTLLGKHGYRVRQLGAKD